MWDEIKVTVTFCGHADFNKNQAALAWLSATIETLIDRGADQFLLGGYGAFDAATAAAVWHAKKIYPHIQSYLVLAYLDRVGFTESYDGSIYPPLENTPRRFSISKRNEWMVRNSDVLVAYVLHGWGGAAAMLCYAEKKGKEIIRYDSQR